MSEPAQEQPEVRAFPSILAAMDQAAADQREKLRRARGIEPPPDPWDEPPQDA